MYMKNNEEFQKMMRGHFGKFTQYELWTIITNQNSLKINTLKIQQHSDSYYYCDVDKLTVAEYLRTIEESQI